MFLKWDHHSSFIIFVFSVAYLYLYLPTPALLVVSPPLPRAPLLLHSHDERLHVDSLVRGVEVFEKIVKALALLVVPPLPPLPRTPLLLHSHDERLHVDSLVRGVEVFEKIVRALGDLCSWSPLPPSPAPRCCCTATTRGCT
ncbi:hypothetical protein JYU34_016934 [Plutella xylostella]|uniref:Uncharacterized protein n=1 Tax=Plutella xylostella TaxID=51655 RepID=A0ABQ7Q589_PLUXY|nr:hypothetical protein JYU34_016934 [Plutella xylostella]